jgi:hypothetical protein
VKLSNSWIIMNPGGPPTQDKPDISLVDYQPGNTTSMFMNLRVADIRACYEEWEAKGAEFVTLPIATGLRKFAATCETQTAISSRSAIRWPVEGPVRRKAPRGSPKLSCMRFVCLSES